MQRTSDINYVRGQEEVNVWMISFPRDKYQYSSTPWRAYEKLLSHFASFSCSSTISLAISLANIPVIK